VVIHAEVVIRVCLVLLSFTVILWGLDCRAHIRRVSKGGGL
jgi:hypothetical protein